MRTAQKWVAEDFGGPDVLKMITTELSEPGPGEVTIEVRAAGMNPADYKRLASGDRSSLPWAPGFEVSGVLVAVGPDTEIASGGGATGDEVMAFRISGGYTSMITVPARDVYAKPPALGFPEAANLFLAGTTAAEMLHVTGVAQDDLILLHGASGAVGVSVLQQARLLGARVIGTASEANFDIVRSFGGIPVSYGNGLESRVREAAAGPVVAALEAVGSDEAVDVSLALVHDRQRIVTIAAFGRAEQDDFRAIGGTLPESAAYRDGIRAHLLDLVAGGQLVVPMAVTYPLSEAPHALEVLRGQHPGGKLALIPAAG
jgi:NADPH2:quinone reductase